MKYAYNIVVGTQFESKRLDTIEIRFEGLKYSVINVGAGNSLFDQNKNYRTSLVAGSVTEPDHPVKLSQHYCGVVYMDPSGAAERVSF